MRVGQEDPSSTKAGRERPQRCCPLLAVQAQPAPGSLGRRPRGAQGELRVRESSPLCQRGKLKPRDDRGRVLKVRRPVSPTEGVCCLEKR